MYRLSLVLVFYCSAVQSFLWPKGVVHFSINQKDYDVHSQEVIQTTLNSIEKEICVKFFNSPLNYSISNDKKILYVSNADKQMDCPPTSYDFVGNIVHMTVGYRCINKRDVARMIVDMLRATIQETYPNVLVPSDVKTMIEGQSLLLPGSSLLALPVRDFINRNYVKECAQLTSPLGLDPNFRRSSKSNSKLGHHELRQLSPDNVKYYANKLWPEGIVYYSVDKDLEKSSDLEALRQAMTTIMLNSCVVFHVADDKMNTRGKIHFTNNDGVDSVLGFEKGTQVINLREFTHGAAGHSAHVLANLLQLLGAPMMSNRPDRDNYVTVNWKNVQKGKEHRLEKAPIESWVRHVPYDFESVSHAPSNFACGDTCKLGDQTVTPLHDPLWQRSLTMGHHTDLSQSDISLLKSLYESQCLIRSLTESAAKKVKKT